MATTSSRQLKCSERELNRMKSHIWDCYSGSLSNNQARVNKFRAIWRQWRGLKSVQGTKEEGDQFEYPMLKWITFGQWSRMMASLLGEDAEIVAKATNPEGQKKAPKIGKYMTWRFFEYMAAIAPLTIWVFRAVLFGRGHAEVSFEQEYYWERRDPKDCDLDELDAAGTRYLEGDDYVDVEVLGYDGPRIRPLWPSQVILPAQDNVMKDEDFSWVIIRERLTPQQLLDGEARGQYQGITKNWTQIAANAQQRQEREYDIDEQMVDVDEAEGVERYAVLGTRDSLDVWRWYGKWRFPTKGDAAIDNIQRRNPNESEVVITYLASPQLIIGVQDLRDVYPRMRKRNPLVSIAPVKDGSYWSPGIGELIEEIQNEATINHNIFRKAGMLSVGPVVFYDPASGFNPQTFEYEPGTAVPTKNPQGIKVVEMKADLQPNQVMEQTLKALGELVTGVSDQSLGRVSDRPNAPQTASGQAMLIQEGNTRVSLDMNMVREDLAKAVSYIWFLDREYADENVFFRVTEEDADGLFDVDQGFGRMTAEEREHPFSFDVKFATSVISREARKQVMVNLYNTSMTNPLVMSNPRALWTLLNRMWEAFGEDSFADIIPAPPQLDQPKTPAQEWTEILQGEEVHVNPSDDDDAHIIDHRRRLAEEMKNDLSRRDQAAESQMVHHIVEHEQQKRQKMLLQVIMQQAVQQVAAAGGLPSQMTQQQPGQKPPPGAPMVPPAAPPAAPGQQQVQQ